jgi:hypothetical protein
LSDDIHRKVIEAIRHQSALNYANHVLQYIIDKKQAEEMRRQSATRQKQLFESRAEAARERVTV